MFTKQAAMMNFLRPLSPHRDTMGKKNPHTLGPFRTEKSLWRRSRRFVLEGGRKKFFFLSLRRDEKILIRLRGTAVGKKILRALKEPPFRLYRLRG